MKTIVILFFMLCYLLVTFFGLGPVLFADGSFYERMMTLLVVILIYAVLTFAFRWLLKRMKR